MKILKAVLTSPIRSTLIVFGISFIGYILLTLLSLYLARVVCGSLHEMPGHCRGTTLQIFTSRLLGDFHLLFRLVAELSVVALIGQLIYRATMKVSK